MIAITMSAKQFACMFEKATHPNAEMQEHDFKLSEIHEEHGLSGHIHTKEIDADYEYREAANTLVLDNEKKHGMYGFVSDKTIGSHLQEILGDLNCPEEVTSSTPAPGLNTGTSNSEQKSNLNQFVKPTVTA